VSDKLLEAGQVPTLVEGTQSLPVHSPTPEHDSASIPSPSTPAPRRRPRAPKDSKVRRTAMAIVALRAQGMKVADAAAHLGIKVETASVYLYRAHKNGWLMSGVFDDPADNLEYVMKSKVVSNIGDMLEHGTYHSENNPAGCRGDKEVTLEVAKGLGLLKQHAVTKIEGGATTVALKVDVIMPTQGASIIPQTIRPGTLGGAPIYDVEIMEEE
jgi:hypothetical protein